MHKEILLYYIVVIQIWSICAKSTLEVCHSSSLSSLPTLSVYHIYKCEITPVNN